MSKFHSVVNRRDFMKSLGFGAAGLGVTAAIGPVFHDLDELASSSSGNEQQPWWIKARAFGNPTTEIAWDQVTPNFSCKTGLDGFGFPGPYPGYFIHKDSPGNPSNYDQTKPGFRMEDYAIQIASEQNSLHDFTYDYFLGPEQGLKQWNIDISPSSWPAWGWPESPKYINVPRWTGTPEEASRMVRSALHYFGAYKVGFSVLDDKFKKLTVPNALEWQDCDAPFFTGKLDHTAAVLGGQMPAKVYGAPNKMKWVIVYQLTEPYDTMRLLHDPATAAAPGPINNSAFIMGYQQMNIVTRRIQTFLKVIGYLGSGGIGIIPYNTGAGALAGLNEIGRHGLGLSPTLGSGYRVNMNLFTDLEVEPTPPIDAGFSRFCETCGVCADICPNQAVYKPKEPTWDLPPTELGRPEYNIPAGTKNTWTRPGVKHWPVDYTRCKGCSYCQGYCTFTNRNFASIHGILKPTVANSTVFNSFLAKADRLFGFNDVDSDFDGWWNRNVDTYPGDMNYAQAIGH